jgi:hypothetical protein
MQEFTVKIECRCYQFLFNEHHCTVVHVWSLLLICHSIHVVADELWQDFRRTSPSEFVLMVKITTCNSILTQHQKCNASAPIHGCRVPNQNLTKRRLKGGASDIWLSLDDFCGSSREHPLQVRVSVQRHQNHVNICMWCDNYAIFIVLHSSEIPWHSILLLFDSSSAINKIGPELNNGSDICR